MSKGQGSILLVVPPFQSITRPALGVSQLKANLETEGFPTEILYANLRFAEQIGLEIYDWISEETIETLIGEFIFSYSLFHYTERHLTQYADKILAGTEYAERLLRLYPRHTAAQALRRLIQLASDFCLGIGLTEILSRKPWMVGFTSSFQQNCASLLLLGEIKRRQPEIITVMGGANCEGEMGEELFSRFREIDYIGQGECDHSFVDLVRSVQNDDGNQAIAGILSRTNDQRIPISRALKSADLDRLPYPDFTEYFGQIASVRFADQVVPGLVMETSRGCWWGAKQHCTFCGLNGEGMAFRSKSGPRVLAEMATLVERYRTPRIEVVDNILDMKYFKTVLPQLAAGPSPDLFYEVKSNLSKEQVRLLASAKVRWIQPGIESLSDGTLQLMRKGTTALQNIQLLKWCAESGIRVGWNYLFGFPGESEEELTDIARIAESIHHLEPPVSEGTLHLDRFSPYFTAPEKYGLEPVYPGKPYAHVYPFPEISLRKIAYFYQSSYFVGKAKSEAFKTLGKIVSTWKKSYTRSHLIAIPRDKSLIILDTRPCALRSWRRLTGLSRRVYESCDHTRNLSAVCEILGAEVNREEVQSILRSFVDARLMLHINGRYLSLATDPQHGYKKFVETFPGGVLHGLEKSANLWHNLLQVKRFRTAPFALAAAVGRRASGALEAAGAALLSKVVFLSVNFLCEARDEQTVT